MQRVLINSAKCLNCGDVLYSRGRHDFVRCKCSAITVDGGNEYTRRLIEFPEFLEERSIIVTKHYDVLEKRLDALESLMMFDGSEEHVDCHDWDEFCLKAARAFNSVEVTGFDSELDPSDYPAIKKGYEWAANNGRNLFGKLCGIARYVQNDRFGVDSG